MITSGAGFTDALKNVPLGLAISRQDRISAIRYPSDACKQVGDKESNVAIFPDAMVLPSRVRILGKDGASLEELPKVSG
jgi:hypothetical protein